MSHWMHIKKKIYLSWCGEERISEGNISTSNSPRTSKFCFHSFYMKTISYKMPKNRIFCSSAFSVEKKLYFPLDGERVELNIWMYTMYTILSLCCQSYNVKHNFQPLLVTEHSFACCGSMELLFRLWHVKSSCVIQHAYILVQDHWVQTASLKVIFIYRKWFMKWKA